MKDQAELTAVLPADLPKTVTIQAVTRSSAPRERARRFLWSSATTALSLGLFLLVWHIATLYRVEL